MCPPWSWGLPLGVKLDNLSWNYLLYKELDTILQGQVYNFKQILITQKTQHQQLIAELFNSTYKTNMTNETTLITKSPAECSKIELEKFVTLVDSEEEVEGGLMNRVKTRGEKLIFLYVSGTLAGTAGIKRPYDNYRSSVFNKAKASLSPNSFSLELGWIVVSPAFRRRGFAHRLIKESMNIIGENKIFSTTRESNTAIHNCLEFHNFKICGEAFLSRNGRSNLVLFTRH